MYFYFYMYNNNQIWTWDQQSKFLTTKIGNKFLNYYFFTFKYQIR